MGPTPKNQYEYVVVGSGAGGGTLAARLALAGHRVMLLQVGGLDAAIFREPRKLPAPSLLPVPGAARHQPDSPWLEGMAAGGDGGPARSAPRPQTAPGGHRSRARCCRRCPELLAAHPMV